MASIGQYLDSMVVSALSPDQNIHARVSNYSDVEIEFRPGVFHTYDEERLSHQLARLGILTWVAYRRGRSDAYRRAHGHAETASIAADPRRQRYEEALNRLEAEGVSTNHALRVNTVGMMQWKVHIQPGAIRRLGERLFVNEIHSAVNALFEDRSVKIVVLKSDYFDLGLPKAWRDLLTRLRAAKGDRR